MAADKPTDGRAFATAQGMTPVSSLRGAFAQDCSGMRKK